MSRAIESDETDLYAEVPSDETGCWVMLNQNLVLCKAEPREMASRRQSQAHRTKQSAGSAGFALIFRRGESVFATSILSEIDPG